jgi:ABC-2 type transport system permease protein
MKYLSMNIKTSMQHKASFFMMLAVQFLMSFSSLAALYFLATRFNEVEGFTFPEVLLCFAVMNMAYSLAEMFTRGFDVFSRLLGDGRFDRILTRPRGVLFQVCAGQVEFHRLGRLTQAALVFAYAIPNCGVAWTADKICVLCLMVTCGAVVFFALFLIHAGITFFTLHEMEFINVLTHGGREFGRYPYSVYGEGVMKFLTYVIPLALIQYRPLLYLLGRDERLFGAVSPLISLLFVIPAYGLFRYGLRKYKSTGS